MAHSDLSRRSFLAGLLTAAAAPLIVPEPQRVRAYSFMPGVGRASRVLYYDSDSLFIDIEGSRAHDSILSAADFARHASHHVYVDALGNVVPLPMSHPDRMARFLNPNAFYGKMGRST